MVTPLLHVPDEELERYLLEDAPHGDLTTQRLGIAEQQGRISFRSRHSTVLFSTEEAARLPEKVGCHASPGGAARLAADYRTSHALPTLSPKVERA